MPYAAEDEFVIMRYKVEGSSKRRVVLILIYLFIWCECYYLYSFRYGTTSIKV